MADDTLDTLRAAAVQTYWDADRHSSANVLAFNAETGNWSFGRQILREDLMEGGPTRLVLRTTLSPGNEMKLVIPAAQGSLTPVAMSKNIRHICPVYKGPPGELEHHGSLFIFNH